VPANTYNNGMDSNGCTRRAFVGTIPAFAALPAAASGSAAKEHRYRAVSWWLTWDDLTWPNDELKQKVRRRADRCAASGVNCCLIFGAHFRWDFMPVWGRLHDLLRYIRDELHQRGIALFDHHSSVLVHRTRSAGDALDIWRRNRHHVPFYPSMETAAEWRFNGSRLNDWRMIDVETGGPVYLPAYNAEQFCMNNPRFRDSYLRYVTQLLRETGIHGLMSDDGIFYAGWQACGCKHCRERFHKEYGHGLPPVADTSFWGNRCSKAFGDWIEMRFRTCGDWLAEIKKALPADFPLLTCCSSSDGHNMPASGMSYQDFIRSCNLVLLEMTGSTPSAAGAWDNRLPSQLLHLGIARDHRVNCFGLGYGFFPDTAFFVWALNKFLGSDCWLSSLKGRLNAQPAELNALRDDSELVEEGYRWELANPGLFVGEVDADTAVFFSRATRDHYGQCAGDYVSDYHAACLELMRAGLSYEVVTAIPEPGRWRRLLLSSAACLSGEERRALARFLEAGGAVIAVGPAGHYDERARPAKTAWLEEFGAAVEIVEPRREGSFPPGRNLGPAPEIAQCRPADALRARMRDGWYKAPLGDGHLLWWPDRMTDRRAAAAVIDALRQGPQPALPIEGLPADWRVRQYRDLGRLLIHAIPAKVGVVFHSTLQNQFTRERVVEKLAYTPLRGALAIRPRGKFASVSLHSPDLAGPRAARRGAGGAWVIDISGIQRYFILECVPEPPGGAVAG
jgi:hypothetical protein